MFEIAARLLPDAAPDLLLRQAELVHERGAGPRRVDRIQVLARHVLDQRELEALARPRVERTTAGNALEAGQLRRPQRRSPAISS